MKKEIQLDANGKRKFGFRDKLAYAAGDLGCNMSFSLKGTIQTFWLVYMMLDLGLLSVLLLVVQIWDAINDPLIGSMIDADKRKYKLGKFKTYVLIGSIGLLVAGSLCFIPLPEGIRMSEKLGHTIIKSAIFIIAYVIWDACYTVANIPYGSMLSLVTENPGERAQLSTWRSIGSMIGNMLPMVLLPFLIWRDILDENGNPIKNEETGEIMQELVGGNVFWTALIMGVIGFICFLFMIKKITLRVDENSVKTNETEKFNVLEAFKNFIKNRPAVGATLAAMAMFLGMNAATTAISIMFTVYFGKGELSGIVSVVGFLPMLFFMPFIKKIVEKWGKKEASVAGALVSVIGAVLMFIFPIVGASGNKTVALIVYMASLCIFGLGMGVYTCVSWALMADAIDYSEWKTGKREEGTVYSLHSFFRKLAQSIGPSMVLLLMALIGYDDDKKVGEQTLQTAENMCWLVAGLYLFSAILMFVGLAFIYNLDKKTTENMLSDLESRKAASSETEEGEAV